MISDQLLEFNPAWSAIANAGIGGPVPYVAPKVFTATSATAENPYLKVTIEGSGYTDMMAYLHRPLMPVFDPSRIYYDYVFTVTPDSDTAVIQSLESEASFADVNGYYYNNSLQNNNVNPKGHLQAYASPTNVWVDTGIVVPMYAPNTLIKISYLVDTVNHNMSTLSITIGGKVYPLPAMFQKVPGFKRNWTPGVYCQFQQNLASKGGSMTNKYSNINLNWL